MTQFRKFEIDAMVDGVCTKILCNADHVETQFTNQPEYTALIIGLNDLRDAVKRVKQAEEEVSILRRTLNDDLNSFNIKYGNEVFSLKYDYGYSTGYGSHNEKLTFETSINGYHGARSTIASELAVALLPSDAKDNIMQIVSDLADKFIVDIN